MCHDNEEWFTIWRGIDLSVQNWHEEFINFDPSTQNLNNLYFNGLLLTKYV